MMHTLFARAIDLLYPRTCANCARIGQAWCPACFAELAAYQFRLTERTLDDGTRVLAVGVHEGILRSAIHALKFEEARDLAEPLGRELATGISQSGIEADLIVPVPLHSLRYQWRGYNQSALLAETAALYLNLACEPAVNRMRDTGTQVGRDAAARHQAMIGAFSADDVLARGRRVLLIDDVVTTGSTIMACVAALRNAGAADVTAVCVTSAS